MPQKFAHQPVLLEESIGHLNLKPGGVIVDCTLGGGGHAEAILRGTDPDGVLIGFDVDRAGDRGGVRHHGHRRIDEAGTAKIVLRGTCRVCRVRRIHETQTQYQQSGTE